MSRRLERRLQNLDYSTGNLRILKTFLDTGNLPADYSDYQKKRYALLYSPFEERNGTFYYPSLDLEVVKDINATAKLKAMYNDPQQGIGLGIRTFYSKVTAKYLNITRDDIRDFLQSQTVYQLVKSEPRQVNKPIIATYPNQRWAMDLIDINQYAGHNNNNNFILTIIDYFSKKVFATGLKNKDDQTLLTGLEHIINTQAEGTYPKLLQSDNGGEFKNGLLNAWGTTHDVKLIHTVSYSPTGNALIENFNNILRKMIREGFIRHNSFNWVNHLNDYLINKNDTKHSTTKETPDNIWRAGLDKRIDEPIIRDVRKRIEDRAEASVKRNTTSEYEVGDKVRVLMSSLYSEVRKVIKAGDQKQIPVKYSPEVFTIKRIVKPKAELKDFTKLRYNLSSQNGLDVITQIKLNNPNRKRGPQIFFATELQLVPSKPDKIITSQQANKLNKIGIDDYNQEEEEALKRSREGAVTRQRAKRIIEKESAIPIKEKSQRIRKPNSKYVD